MARRERCWLPRGTRRFGARVGSPPDRVCKPTLNQFLDNLWQGQYAVTQVAFVGWGMGGEDGGEGRVGPRAVGIRGPQLLGAGGAEARPGGALRPACGPARRRVVGATGSLGGGGRALGIGGRGRGLLG